MDSFYGAVPPPASALYPPGYSPRDQVVFELPDGNEVRTGYQAANIQQQWNLVDTFSLTAGPHQLKFGLDFRRLNLTNGRFNSFFLFSDGYDNLQAGTESEVALFADAGISARTNQYSSFAQDTWKVLPSLTLTYGLRWDINTPPVSTTPEKPLYACTL